MDILFAARHTTIQMCSYDSSFKSYSDQKHALECVFTTLRETVICFMRQNCRHLGTSKVSAKYINMLTLI
jgi:hypothetical protein